jgi:hypothetical protein
MMMEMEVETSLADLFRVPDNNPLTKSPVQKRSFLGGFE